MVEILERTETMGDVPTRRAAVGKRYASNLDRVTLCYFRFGMLSLDVPSARNHDWIQADRVFLPYGHTARGEKVSTSVDLPLSLDCKRVLAYGAEEAERLNHQHIGTDHLLLGLLREKDSFAAQL